jgi:hypothetical protein
MSQRVTRFEVGDKVRDRTQLGGEVVETWGDAVRVQWNNGVLSWVAGAWMRLSKDGESAKQEG